MIPIQAVVGSSPVRRAIKEKDIHWVVDVFFVLKKKNVKHSKQDLNHMDEILNLLYLKQFKMKHMQNNSILISMYSTGLDHFYYFHAIR